MLSIANQARPWGLLQHSRIGQKRKGVPDVFSEACEGGNSATVALSASPTLVVSIGLSPHGALDQLAAAAAAAAWTEARPFDGGTPTPPDSDDLMDADADPHEK